MALTTEFIPLKLDQLRREAAVLKADGWRFIQTHAVYTDDGVDLYYSFMKDGHAVNYWIKGVQKGTPVPSITDLFLAAFVFENEARELFGVDMRDIVLDFAGAMYAPAVNEPMTIISPEQKAAREKARKAAAAKAAKNQASVEGSATGEASADASSKPAASPSGGKRIFVMTPERQARLDAKLPTLSDEKRAKVEAALKARAAEAQAAAEGPASAAEPAASAKSQAAEKAPEVQAAQSGVAASAGGEVKAAGKTAEKPQDSSAPQEKAGDAALEHALSLLDPNKATKVRAVLEGKAPEAGNTSASASAEKPVESGTVRLDDEKLETLIGAMDDAKAAVVRAALAAKGGN